MSMIELILASLGVSLNIFAVTLYWGGTLRSVRKGWLLIATLIIGAWEGVAFLIGHSLVQYPIMIDMHGLEYRAGQILTILIFGGLGLHMFYKSVKPEILQERLKPESYRIVEIVTLAALCCVGAFMVGMGTAFVGTRIVRSAVLFIVVTMLNVVGGIYGGYWYGFSGRRYAYRVGGGLLMICCAGVLVRLLV